MFTDQVLGRLTPDADVDEYCFVAAMRAFVDVRQKLSDKGCTGIEINFTSSDHDLFVQIRTITGGKSSNFPATSLSPEGHPQPGVRILNHTNPEHWAAVVHYAGTVALAPFPPVKGRSRALAMSAAWVKLNETAKSH